MTKTGKHPNDWSEEQIELLRNLAQQNQSARAIAAAFPGKSRNAILGKAYRLGIGIHSFGLGRTYDTFWVAEKFAELRGLYFSAMGYSNQEIAAQLGCSMATLRRGLAKMRSLDGPLKPKPNRGQFATDGRHKERGAHNGAKVPFIINNRMFTSVNGKRPRTAAARVKARAAHPPLMIADLNGEPLPATAVTILGLNGHTCRWPVHGAGVDMLYCGAVPVRVASHDLPYCGIHCRRAFQ